MFRSRSNLFRYLISIAIAASVLIAHSAHASEPAAFKADTGSYRHELVCIDTPWAYESLGRPVGAAFMAISSRKNATDELIGSSSPIASRVDIHDIIMKAGNMVMTPVENLAVSSESPLELKPHGLHIMLMGLNEPLEADTTFPLILEFDKSGMIQIQVSVLKISHSPPEYDLVCD